MLLRLNQLHQEDHVLLLFQEDQQYHENPEHQMDQKHQGDPIWKYKI